MRRVFQRQEAASMSRTIRKYTDSQVFFIAIYGRHRVFEDKYYHQRAKVVTDGSVYAYYLLEPLDPSLIDSEEEVYILVSHKYVEDGKGNIISTYHEIDWDD